MARLLGQGAGDCTRQVGWSGAPVRVGLHRLSGLIGGLMERKPIIPAIGAGVDLLFREPGAVLVWGLITTVVTVVPSALILLLIGGGMVNIMAAQGAGEPPDPTALIMAQPLQLLQYLGLLLVVAVIYPAIMRATLFPEERRRAFIRFGSTELFFGLFVVVLYIAMIIAFLLAALVIVVVMFAAAAAAPQSGAGAIAAISIFLALGLIPVTMAFSYVFSRLWMAAPIIVATGQFKLLDGWTLTRGYGWRLTGMAILLGIISYLLQIFLTVIAAAISAAIFGINFGAIFSGDMDALLNAAPSLIGAVLLGSAISVFIVTPVFIAPWARVYSILNGGTEQPAIVFD